MPDPSASRARLPSPGSSEHAWVAAPPLFSPIFSSSPPCLFSAMDPSGKPRSGLPRRHRRPPPRHPSPDQPPQPPSCTYSATASFSRRQRSASSSPKRRATHGSFYKNETFSQKYSLKKVLRVQLPKTTRAFWQKVRDGEPERLNPCFIITSTNARALQREKNDGLLMTKMMDQLRVGFFGTPVRDMSYLFSLSQVLT